MSLKTSFRRYVRARKPFLDGHFRLFRALRFVKTRLQTVLHIFQPLWVKNHVKYAKTWKWSSAPFEPKIADIFLLRWNITDQRTDSDFPKFFEHFEYFLWYFQKTCEPVAAKNVFLAFCPKIEKSKITPDPCRIILIWLHFWNLHKIWTPWVCCGVFWRKLWWVIGPKVWFFEFRIFAKMAKIHFEPL